MTRKIKIGDLVTRLSYGGDIVFRVVGIDEESGIVFLRGEHLRLMADAPLNDLEVCDDEAEIDKKSRWFRQNRFRQLIQKGYLRRKGLSGKMGEYGQIRGTVLHLDGDERYLKACLDKYNELKIIANGYHIPEEEQPVRVQKLLRKYRPDVLIITGHDGMKRSGGNDLSNYYNSRYFVESVSKARELESDKDSLIIFAGACQSYYEALIEAGANFASSPERINIHTLDPVKVAEVIVQTSIKKVVSINRVIKHSISGIQGIGGIESRGKMRLSLPKILKN
ncbi:sporulation peptidase YabG [Anoxybacter fermentans]|uniref:Sporulation peptidase YabG n=1 Tax=Anoxybacter fermentans TaxID=1323375 RepID=A0A3S9T1L5_9FIRM|nr:sporulation peptidase YabG [Anoxybacter fermentans]AZR74441.1 sporulation peptidase YabG [Anoxybacter fermentans]